MIKNQPALADLLVGVDFLLTEINGKMRQSKLHGLARAIRWRLIAAAERATTAAEVAL